MKLLPLLVTVSLAANVALLGVVWKQSAARAGATGSSTPAPTETSPEKKPEAVAKDSSEDTLAGAAALLAGNDSGPLSGSDLKTLAERLRAAGFSAKLIRTIISSIIQERFSAQMRELQEKTFATNTYWKSRRPSYGMNREMMAKSQEWTKERQRLLREALGDADADPNENVFLRAQTGGLSAEKQAGIQRILSDYNEMRTEIHANAEGVMLPADREKLAFIEKEQQADIEKLLTPEELFEYRIRSSDTSNRLRESLRNFEVSEEEFRTMFRNISASLGSDTSPTAFDRDSYQRIQSAVKEGIKSVLSPERMAEFERVSDPQYDQTSRLVARLNLPPTATQQVLDIQKQTMESLRTMMTSASAEQHTTQANALLEQANQRLRTVLGGESGLQAYRDYGGQWLQSITRMANPPSRPGNTQTPVFLPGISIGK